MMDKEVDNFLAHFGVKGMRWGRRKATENSGDSSGSSPKPKKLTRKEARAEKDAFYQNKGTNLLNKALKDPDILIELHNGDIIPTITTGKEFVSYLEKGGVMNLKMTDVFAQQEKKNGQYVLNENREKYVRSDKRK